MKKMFSLMLASALALSLMTGCGSPAQSPVTPGPQPETAAPLPDPQPAAAQEEALDIPDPQAVGVVLLSVNPEIEVKYNSKGLVVELDSRNADGEKIVTLYGDFTGKTCEEVVAELVELIYAEGYFQQNVAGQAKNVVIKLEEGSLYPDDGFLEEVARGVRKAVEKKELTSKPVTIDQKDLDEKGYIGLEKAKELVLTQLGVKEADFVDREYELDNGRYELEFTVDGIEYEFEVDAVSGKVLEADYEPSDDRVRPQQKPETKPEIKPEPEQKPETKPDKNDKVRQDYITLAEAREAALKYLDLDEDAKFTDRDQDLDDGKYEIEFTLDGVEYDVDVDARTGEVLRVDKERDDDRNDRPADKPAGDYVTLDEARKAALKYLDLDEDAKFTDRDQDLDDGKYEIEFTLDGVEYDVDVDARTGEVLRVDKERDDDRNDRDDRYDRDDRWDDDDDWDDRYDDDDDWDDRYDDDDD